MPINGGVASSCVKGSQLKQNWDGIKNYDSDDLFEKNGHIEIEKSSGSQTESRSDPESGTNSDETFVLLDSDLDFDRLKPVSLRIVDFYQDFLNEIRRLMDKGLDFEYEDCLIKFMINYQYCGQPYDFTKFDIQEVGEISDIPENVLHARYKLMCEMKQGKITKRG